MGVAPPQPPIDGEFPDLIGAEARALIGVELSRRTGAVDRREFQRWAMAVRDRNRLYFDAEHARSVGHPDVVMPPLYLPLVAAGLVDLDELNADGTPADVGVGAVPLPRCPRRMAGGIRWTFRNTVYPADVVTEITTLTALEQKRGRAGPFVLIRLHTDYARGSALVAESVTTFIARP